MNQLQDRPIVVGTPVEIDRACNLFRLRLAQLPWISHPYFIAKRFVRQEKPGTQKFYYPETYAPVVGSTVKKESYHRLTPDSDYSGMCFFYVGQGKNDFAYSDYNFITYKVAIIFSVNLKLIDAAKLEQGIFTRELMRDARRVITDTKPYVDFNYKILTETDDLRETYREFVLDDLQAYNRAPQQCFRFDLDVTIEEDCIDVPISALPDMTDNNFNITTIDVDGNVLPINIQEGTGFLILNVDNLTEDLNLQNYTPTGLVKGATVRVRKMDDSDFKIQYADGSLEYSFVNCATEFIDLLWDGSRLII